MRFFGRFFVFLDYVMLWAVWGMFVLLMCKGGV